MTSYEIYKSVMLLHSWGVKFSISGFMKNHKYMSEMSEISRRGKFEYSGTWKFFSFRKLFLLLTSFTWLKSRDWSHIDCRAVDHRLPLCFERLPSKAKCCLWAERGNVISRSRFDGYQGVSFEIQTIEAITQDLCEKSSVEMKIYLYRKLPRIEHEEPIFWLFE